MTSPTPDGFQQRLGNQLTVLAAEPATAPGDAPTPAPRPRPWAMRHRLSLAIAGLAAVGAGITTVAVHHPTTPARTAQKDAVRPPQKITTAAYTLQREDDGRVRVAISDPAGKLLDIGRLQRDLNRLGVPAVVYAGDPECTDMPTSPGDDSSNKIWHIELTKGGKPVLSVRPDRIPAGQHLLVAFPLLRTDPAHAAYAITAGRIDGTAPACVPAWPKGSAK
ncbi:MULTISPECIES: hypothetical protein [unclassified Streptomyces]|uniref:hypothetical protein n=1 Tax=unclassified Streptomyces TaxID=2593676 RepID=UPI001F04C1D4|nr:MULTISPECIES: hypothetical protein [unclassified Streptomyces]MCH0566475.1 hypothetical protein [Streptomyces sp. MUM 2J]MCH0571893.1 hypothetical protein [Streptomyces sp. MUM 136J]